MKQGVVDVMFILIDFLILYRRAALAREERKNDISKLLQFFQEMRTQNECFYYGIQLDENNVIQMCSGAMLASVRNMKTLEMRLPLTPHIKQTYIESACNVRQIEPSAAKCDFQASSFEQ
jgi:hypothetical protein